MYPDFVKLSVASSPLKYPIEKYVFFMKLMIFMTPPWEVSTTRSIFAEFKSIF
jgi:hypothetical protein